MTADQEHNEREFFRIEEKLNFLKYPDATNLMTTWELIIRNDNLRGVLAGQDKHGATMDRVTYRPVADVDKRINIRSKEASRLRHGQKANRLRELFFAGVGPWSSGLHNNLTSSEYRRLDGPPLAPRYQFSRVISNLKTDHWPLNQFEGNTHFEATGSWDEVISTQGTAFLIFHFEGTERLPRRDLTGIRPLGRQELRESFEAWKADLIRAVGEI